MCLCNKPRSNITTPRPPPLLAKRQSDISQNSSPTKRARWEDGATADREETRLEVINHQLEEISKERDLIEKNHLKPRQTFCNTTLRHEVWEAGDFLTSVFLQNFAKGVSHR
jgi:hypothetical protein